ncbi:MAG: metallophosphoesterase [Nitrososphaerota archaeon]|nr:metallophosphoesterase [Aigarchaeota archaeon]MDW8077051.1 metallophosphoesterase [Nitrososphaerota archaeon]
MSSLIVVGACLTVGYATTKELEVTRINLGLNRKVVFLTDLHLHEIDDVKEKVLNIVAKEQPDAILLGGDTVDSLTFNMDVVNKYFSNLEAREKFAVMGNHEYWSGKAGELARILKENGFVILKDASAQASFGKIYGFDWKEDRRYPELRFEGLVIVHDPNAALSILDAQAVLAGHTHGGIIIAGQPIYSNSVYVRGLYRLKDNNILYVSRGLGQMFPFRYTSPLELVITE